MTILSVFYNLNIVLACTILVLSIGLILFNIYSNIKEKQIKRIRVELHDSLLKYLNTGSKGKSLEILMNKHEGLVIGAIAQIIDKDETPHKERMIPFLESHDLSHFRKTQISHLKSSDRYVRQYAANYLPFIAPKELIIEPLIEALQDHMFEVRFAAAFSLAKLKATEAVPPILDQQNSQNRLPLNEVSEILSQIGEAAINPIIKYSSSNTISDAAKILAISALRKYKPVQAKELILQFLNDPNAEVRIQSAKFLSNIGDAECVKALTTAMNDSRWEVRAASAQSLGHIKDVSAIPALSKGLTDDQWWVRHNAAQALTELGAPGHAELIKNLNNKDKFAKEISLFMLEEQQIMNTSNGDLK